MIKIIGITGPLGSGKTTASEILQSLGYVQYTFSDIIKDEARKRNLPTDVRKILQDIGDELRNKYGNDVLARELFKKAKASKAELIIVDGIRNVGELSYVKKQGGFILGINSTLENRFKRVSKKGQIYYGKTKEIFQTDEMRDRGIGQKAYGQHAQECLEASDVIVDNDKTIASFKKKLLEIISS
ncbi:MAG TPA: AAA family ATPase [Patescibacteria group bacterium]|nr:AAA family ATPase [Patescibacteria group bacterium]